MSHRVAISVKKKAGFASPVDPRFSRAPAFVIIDSQTGKMVAQLDNVGARALYGAEKGAAMTMTNNAVDAVISGGFDFPAYESLSFLDIDMWTISEPVTAKDAFDLYLKRELRKLNLKAL